MIGQTISHYKILEKLGEGGMGVVYKAEDTKLRRPVALKFLTHDLTRDEESKSRFIHEAQAASALDHPNIAVVHEIDETKDGRSFICMAYYDGKTLKEKIKDGRLNVEEAIHIAIQITDGLQRAHEAGIIHRDVKPANVIITSRGELKIVDWGLAKLSSQSRASAVGTKVGTAAYMSPEQAQGWKIDHRTDLFSLGVVLYEMLTGKRPFDAEHESALLYLIVNVDPVAASKLRPEIPQELDRMILRLLEKDPAKRYESAAELRSDLKRLIGISESTWRIAAWPQKIASRKLMIPLAGVIVALLLLLITPVRNAVVKWFSFGNVPEEKHVVVLPFTNLSQNPNDQVMCDGLVEILTSTLTQLQTPSESYWVMAATEVRDKNILSVADARRKFSVTMAITGSLFVENAQVRITMNLVDARTLRQLKSFVFDESRTNLSSLQNDVVIKLAELLEMKMDPQKVQVLRVSGTKVPQAYEFYIQGRGYLARSDKLENISTAIGLFERALKEDSLYTLAYAALGEAYLAKHKLTNDVQWIHTAMKYCIRALELNDQLAPVYLTLGLVRTSTGRNEEAIIAFQEALSLDSLYIDAYRALARVYLKLNDIAKAEEIYKKAIRLKPSYWGSHYDLASFYLSRKLYNQAAEEYKRIVELTPDNPLGYNGLGGAYYALGQLIDARKMFERSISIEPNYYMYSNLATLYFAEGRYVDAARTYEKALGISASDYIVWGNLASTYYWMGERDSARVKFERAVQKAEELRKVNPRDVSVLSRLAEYYSMLEKKTEALKLIQQAMSLEPENLSVMKSVVDVYEQLGDRDQALKLLEHAVKRGIPLADFQRGQTLRNLRADPRFQQLLERLGKKP